MKKHLRNPKSVFLVLSAIVAMLVAAYLFNRPEGASARQSTDDAYVRADFVTVVAEVPGTITDVLVEDDQSVDAGTPLVHIDDRDLRIALVSAEAELASSAAAVVGLEGEVERQGLAIAQARSALAASASTVALAESNKRRFANLAADGSGTVLAKQQADADWAREQSTHEGLKAAWKAAEVRTRVLTADLEKARAAKQLAAAGRDAATLALSRAQIAAPIKGVVAQRAARAGGYVRAGDRLLTLVPLDRVYVEANFRETQLAKMRVGQPVTVLIDALPDMRLSGVVESLSAASAVSFSAIPPHNATGNFTKIVQRLPVRIRIDPDQDGFNQLRVGMSVKPTVDVR